MTRANYGAEILKDRYIKANWYVIETPNSIELQDYTLIPQRHTRWINARSLKCSPAGAVKRGYFYQANWDEGQLHQKARILKSPCFIIQCYRKKCLGRPEAYKERLVVLWYAQHNKGCIKRNCGERVDRDLKMVLLPVQEEAVWGKVDGNLEWKTPDLKLKMYA